ncbi:MAG: TolC family protein [Rikenellaceae bacterium]|nr:TolC family protein [Rikenellaceae bacterium]
MTRLIKLTLLAAMLMPFAAADGQTLSLDEYRRRVLSYSQQMAISQERMLAADEAVKVARTGHKPRIDAAADFNYMVRRLTLDRGTSVTPLHRESWGIDATASQTLYAGGAVRKQVEAARIGSEQARYDAMLTEDNVIYAAEVGYWSMATATAYRDAAVRYLDIIKETYSVISSRFEDGMISKNDLLMIETRLGEAKLHMSNAQTGYRQALISLNTLMGLPVDTPTVISDSINAPLPPMPSALSFDEALASRPDYLLAESDVRLGHARLETTRSQYLPSLSVGFTGRYATGTSNVTGKGFANGIAFAGLKVPIFNWNERKHKSAIDKSTIRMSQERLSQTADQINQSMHDAYTRMSASYSELETAWQSVRVAEESLSLSTFSYNAGLLSILDVLSAQLSWLSAYNNLVATNYNCRVAIADYMMATGHL